MHLEYNHVKSVHNIINNYMDLHPSALFIHTIQRLTKLKYLYQLL